MSDEIRETGVENESGDRPEPLDELGLTYQELNQRLLAKHKTVVHEGDPVLVLVGVMNVYLNEFEKLHKRHDEAMARIISAKTAEYISGVKQTTEALTKTLSDASVEGIRKTFDEQAGRLKAFEIKLFWCSALIGLSAFINAALYILK